MNQEQYEKKKLKSDKLKKKCGYTKCRSCSNCKHFENMTGMGYSYQFCGDERNEIPHNKGEWVTGMSVEPDGLCNYWEPSYTKLPEPIEYVRDKYQTQEANAWFEKLKEAE